MKSRHKRSIQLMVPGIFSYFVFSVFPFYSLHFIFQAFISSNSKKSTCVCHFNNRSSRLVLMNFFSKKNASEFEKKVIDYVESRLIYCDDTCGIMVDGFRFVQPFKRMLTSALLENVEEKKLSTVSSKESPSCSVFFFLSHFHSDHYTGLSSSWNAGIIFCSEETAPLLSTQLGVPSTYVVPLKIGRNYVIKLKKKFNEAQVKDENTWMNLYGANLLLEKGNEPMETLATTSEYFVVRLISANHCPGAVMFLFYLPFTGFVLHTGDFRFQRRSHMKKATTKQTVDASNVEESDQSFSPYVSFLEDDLYLVSVLGKIKTLFCDNTYCDPHYKFPIQEEAIGAVIQHTRKLLRNVHPFRDTPKRVAVLIGSYTIGKERIALELQREFSSMKTNRPFHTSLDISFQNSEVSLSTCSLRGPTKDLSPTNDYEPPIWVSAAKFQMLSALNFYSHQFRNWEAEELSIFSGDTEEEKIFRPPTKGRTFLKCNRYDIEKPEVSPSVPFFLDIFLVPMSCTTFQSIRLLAEAKRGKETSGNEHLPLKGTDNCLLLNNGFFLDVSIFDEVLAVEPSGFSKRVKYYNMSNSCYHHLSVSYSEHCSFEELIDFVSFINPESLIPTVDNAQYRRYETLFMDKANRLRSKYNVVPITRFLVSNQKDTWKLRSGEKKAMRGEDRPTMSLPKSDSSESIWGSGRAAKTNPFPCATSEKKTFGSVCLSSHSLNTRGQPYALIKTISDNARMDSLESVVSLHSNSEEEDCCVVKGVNDTFAIFIDD